MDKPPFADFSQNLRCLRNHFGIPQADVASHLGISQPAYQKMECSPNPPRLARLQQIAGYYGISFLELLEWPLDDLAQRVRSKEFLPPPP
ncbi:MAG: helix-turn-helix transcriptional regulator [Saprospiraceae bacterium]